MRLKSSIFIAALMRQETACGAFATVLNKGAEDAGAIFIVHFIGPNNADFYGPAPQMFFEGDEYGKRLFECLGTGLSDAEINEKIKKQTDFDNDCWVLEIEKTEALTSIELADTNS